MKQTSRTRSPSTYQIDIDEELLWQPVESSSDERDEARIEFYLCEPIFVDNFTKMLTLSLSYSE